MMQTLLFSCFCRSILLKCNNKFILWRNLLKHIRIRISYCYGERFISCFKNIINNIFNCKYVIVSIARYSEFQVDRDKCQHFHICGTVLY